MSTEYPEILTLQQTAEYLQISERTVHRMVKRGELPGVQVGGQWRFDRETLRAMVRGDWTPPPEPKTQRELVEEETRRLGVDRPETLLEMQRVAKRRLEGRDEEPGGDG